MQIQDVSEQSFIQKFLMRHDPNYAVWIGLHDIYSEGSFEWTSGTVHRDVYCLNLLVCEVKVTI